MSKSLAFEWPKAENPTDKIILQNVREHGCHVIGIPDARPHYAFSVGLFANFGHPELIIFGLKADQGPNIINKVRDRVVAGQKFADGDLSDDLLTGGYKASFWEVPLRSYRRYLGAAIWFYGKSPEPFPCLQIIWQDRNRKFPWEEGCDPAMKAEQPLLKTVS